MNEAGFFWFDAPRTRERVRTPPPIPDTDWTVPEVFPDLSSYDVISVDCETCDPDLLKLGPGAHRGGYICGVAVGAGEFRAYYPVAHEVGPNLPKEVVFGWLSEQLCRPRQPKVGANLIYDVDFLLTAGVKIAGPLWDVQVAEPLLNETRLSYALDVLAKDYLGEGKVEQVMRRWLSDAFGSKNVKGNIYRAPPAVVGPYAESDVDLPLRIFELQRPQLQAQGLWDLFEMESELLWVLLHMRRRGVRVDVPLAEQLRDMLSVEQKERLAEIKRQTGVEPEIWAADSLARMFDKAGIEYPRTPKTKRPSFKKEWLSSHPSPLARAIQQARYFDKLRGTFIEGYILEGNVNGRIHTSFHGLRSDAGGTETGRLSSSGPNLQNIPVRGKEGKLIRQCFIPEEGEQWWKLDWSQIEYRLIVHFAHLIKLAGSQGAVDAYNSDPKTDFHQLVAAMTGLMRDEAKALNFGMAYGLGIEALCASLLVDIQQGRIIINTYHERAPYVRQLKSNMERAAVSRGYIRTLLGRRRRFNLWEYRGEVTNEYRPGARRAFTRNAMNSGIQGSAADIMKKAMVMIMRSGVLDTLGMFHLTVHDELDGSCPPGPAALEALAEVRHVMETCIKLVIPIYADGGLGLNWGNLVDF